MIVWIPRETPPPRWVSPPCVRPWRSPPHVGHGQSHVNILCSELFVLEMVSSIPRKIFQRDLIGSPTQRQNRRPTFSTKTPMSDHRLPQEIIDYILDLLRKEPRTLKQCHLVSRSWAPRARTHLFRRIDFYSDWSCGFDDWKMMFPEPENSPGSLVHTLTIYYPEGIVDLLDEDGWIQSFSHVVRLRIRTRENDTCCVASHHFSNLSTQSKQSRHFRRFSS